MPGLRWPGIRDVVQAIGEEWKVAAEDNMGRETNHGRDLLFFVQICDQALEGDLSLREGALIEGREDLSRLDQRNQFLEENRW